MSVLMVLSSSLPLSWVCSCFLVPVSGMPSSRYSGCYRICLEFSSDFLHIVTIVQHRPTCENTVGLFATCHKWKFSHGTAGDQQPYRHHRVPAVHGIRAAEGGQSPCERKVLWISPCRMHAFLRAVGLQNTLRRDLSGRVGHGKVRAPASGEEAAGRDPDVEAWPMSFIECRHWLRCWRI